MKAAETTELRRVRICRKRSYADAWLIDYTFPIRLAQAFKPDLLAFMTVFFASLAFFLGLAKAMTAQGTDTPCVATRRKLEGRFSEDHFPGQDNNSKSIAQ